MTDTQNDTGRSQVQREVATVQVEPGPGFVARVRNLVVWVEPEPGESGTAGLDTVAGGLDDIAGRLLPEEQAITQVSALLTDARVAALAGVAAVVPTAAGLVALSHGWGSVQDGRPGVHLVEVAEEVLALGRRDIARRLQGSLPPRQAGIGPAATGLIHGVVPGGGATVGTRISIAGPGIERTHSVPAGDVIPVTDTDSFDHDDEPDVEVIIEGIECLRGHLNNPLALHCSTCGISMIQKTSIRIEGVRPPLGIIVFDDGTAYSLAGNHILGSAPDRADPVIAGKARGVQLVDPADEIEPLHAELRLLGWDVTVVDWSTRGTFLLPEDAAAWQVAPRGTPVVLTPGTRIALGSRTLLFDTEARLASRR